MIRLRIGEPLYPGISEFAEGTHFNYTISGLSLIYSVSSPDSSLINSFRQGEATLGIAIRDQALFLLSKIGTIPWRVAHYNWWINPPVMRPDPMGSGDIITPISSIAGILIDSETGIIQAFRSLFPPKTFARRLLIEVEYQIRSRFEPWDYLDLVEGVLGSQSDVDALVSSAICMNSCNKKEENYDPESEWIRLWGLN